MVLGFDLRWLGLVRWGGLQGMCGQVFAREKSKDEMMNMNVWNCAG
jgi:hypothetical protein